MCKSENNTKQIKELNKDDLQHLISCLMDSERIAKMAQEKFPHMDWIPAVDSVWDGEAIAWSENDQGQAFYTNECLMEEEPTYIEAQQYMIDHVVIPSECVN